MTAILLIGFSSVAVSQAESDEPVNNDKDVEISIERLVGFIGSWDFDDSQLEGDYRETGTRDCQYALDEQYILCESKGTTASGQTRRTVGTSITTSSTRDSR